MPSRLAGIVIEGDQARLGGRGHWVWAKSEEVQRDRVGVAEDALGSVESDVFGRLGDARAFEASKEVSMSG